MAARSNTAQHSRWPTAVVFQLSASGICRYDCTMAGSQPPVPTSSVGAAVRSAITQCPHCAARFRIRAEQVKAYAGLVRCGACRGVFDARAHITEGSLEPDLSHAPMDSKAANPRTIIPGLVGADAPTPSVHPTSEGIPDEGPDPAPAADPVQYTGHVRNLDYEAWRAQGRRPSSREDAGADAADARTSYRWRRPRVPMSRVQWWGWATLCLLLLAFLSLQVAIVFRDTIAAHVPSAKPFLARLCETAACRIEPPRTTGAAGFVGAELAADPAHQGLLIFTATLRNSKSTPVAFPHLVLTLEATNNVPVARKVFAPAQYLPANASVEKGLPGDTDVEIKLYLDASQINPVGFKVDQAYL